MANHKWVFFLVSFLMLFASCRKEQRKVNRIEGKWVVQWAELNGFGKSEPDLVFKFDWCKVRFDDFCDFSAYDFNLNEQQFGIYSISKNGKQLTLKWSENNMQYFEVFNIERLNFRTLHLSNVNTNSFYFSEIRMRNADF